LDIREHGDALFQDMARLMHNFRPDLIVHYFLGKLIAAPQVCENVQLFYLKVILFHLFCDETMLLLNLYLSSLYLQGLKHVLEIRHASLRDTLKSLLYIGNTFAAVVNVAIKGSFLVI